MISDDVLGHIYAQIWFLKLSSATVTVMLLGQNVGRVANSFQVKGAKAQKVARSR